MVNYKKKYLKYKKKYLNAKQRGGMEARDSTLEEIVEQWHKSRKTALASVSTIDDKINEKIMDWVVWNREAAVIEVLDEIYRTRYNNLKSIIDTHKLPWLLGFDSVVLYDLIMITKIWLWNIREREKQQYNEKTLEWDALKYVYEVMIRRAEIPVHLEEKTSEYAFSTLHRIWEVDHLFIKLKRIMNEEENVSILKRLIGNIESGKLYYDETDIEKIKQEYFGDFLTRITLISANADREALRALWDEDEEEDMEYHMSFPEHFVSHSDHDNKDFEKAYEIMLDIYQRSLDLGLPYTEIHHTEVVDTHGRVYNPYGDLINEFWMELQKIADWEKKIMQPNINCSLPAHRWSLHCFIRLRLVPIDSRFNLSEPGGSKALKQEINFMNRFNVDPAYKKDLLSRFLPSNLLTDFSKWKAVKPTQGTHTKEWTANKQNKLGSPPPGTNVVNKTDIVIMGENGEVLKVSLKSGEGRLTSSGYAETRALFILVFNSLSPDLKTKELQESIEKLFDIMDDKKQWLPKDRNFGILKQLAQDIRNPVWVGRNPGQTLPRAYNTGFTKEEIEMMFPEETDSRRQLQHIDKYLTDWCGRKQKEFNELNILWAEMKAKHRDFCLKVLEETMSGKLKFGEDNIGCANVFVELESSTNLNVKDSFWLTNSDEVSRKTDYILNKIIAAFASKMSGSKSYTRFL